MPFHIIVFYRMFFIYNVLSIVYYTLPQCYDFFFSFRKVTNSHSVSITGNKK